MFNLTKIVLFLCIASGLTLSVSNESKTDGTSENTSLDVNQLNTSSTIVQRGSNQVTSTTVPSARIKGPQTKENNLLQTESGPISILPSQQSPMSNQNISTTNDITVEVQNISTEKTVSKIIATNEDKSLLVLDRKRGSLLGDQATVNDEKQSSEMHSTTKDSHANINSLQGENINGKIDDKSPQLNNTSVVQPVSNLLEKKLHNGTKFSFLNKHKPNPKPTVTMGGGAADPNKPIPPSPTKSSPLGMPRKIDYIIPIAISVVALPILGVTTFILYNRGKDCWDKRHYRRMDFLIDGMYND